MRKMRRKWLFYHILAFSSKFQTNLTYEMRAVRSYGCDNVTRKVNEAVRISEHKGVILNSKAEYRQPKVPRVVIQESVNDR